MFTVTQRLLVTPPVSLPHPLPVPLRQPHSPLTRSTSQGLGRGRGYPPTPKPERARLHQRLQMCLPPPSHVGDRAGAGV